MPKPIEPIAREPHRPATCAVREDCPVSSGCAPLGTPLCDGVEDRHAAKLRICDALEAIADSLPLAIDRGACLWASANLLPVVREAQHFEESALFPAFGRQGTRIASVQRLRAEHVEDEALAEELTETLLRIGHGGDVANPEALGFMLRAFFEAMRRHVAFEREHVVPLARGGDTSAD